MEGYRTEAKIKRKRTTVYFGRPYHSCDRASNENCNGLIRYFIKKGTDINTIDKETTIDINNKINQKKRKILGYLSSEELFLNELAKLNVTIIPFSIKSNLSSYFQFLLAIQEK